MTAIETPEQLLERDVVDMPHYTRGMGGPHYAESTFIAIVRLWKFIVENNISSRDYKTANEFDLDYGDELHPLLDDLGLSMFQFASCVSVAFMIVDNGFETWREIAGGAMGTVEWEPTDEFEWDDEKQTVDWVYIAVRSDDHEKLDILYTCYPELTTETLADLEYDYEPQTVDLDELGQEADADADVDADDTVAEE